MDRIVSIGLAVVRQNREVPCFRDPEPSSLLLTLKISGREDILVMGMPPMWSARRTEDEFIAVVEYDEGVGRMCGGDENDTHGCCRLHFYGVAWKV